MSSGRISVVDHATHLPDDVVVEMGEGRQPHSIRIWTETPKLSMVIVGRGWQWNVSWVEELGGPVESIGPATRRGAVAAAEIVFNSFGITVRKSIRSAWKEAKARSR
jgi:hypothetical protein